MHETLGGNLIQTITQDLEGFLLLPRCHQTAYNVPSWISFRGLFCCGVFIGPLHLLDLLSFWCGYQTYHFGDSYQILVEIEHRSVLTLCCYSLIFLLWLGSVYSQWPWKHKSPIQFHLSKGTNDFWNGTLCSLFILNLTDVIMRKFLSFPPLHEAGLLAELCPQITACT